MKSTNLLKAFIACALIAPAMVSCSDDDKVAPVYEVAVDNTLPEGYTIESLSATFTEINTGVVTTTTNLSDLHLAAGTYNIEATATVTETASKAAEGEKTMRAVAQNVVITETTKSINLDWFFYNPDNSLVLSEIYIGSLNAKGTGCVTDSYIKIYNNTDEVLYADGLAICESQLNNTTKYTGFTNDADPESKFITGAVYVIPGNGTDVPIEPGKSIKIVDQAINWADEVPGAVNNLDADFEWYDVSQMSSVQDTDNPDVPNMDKWYAETMTIWFPSNQANRSYALIRFPDGMDVDKYLQDYMTSYTYTFVAPNGSSFEGKGNNKYYVSLDWIIDGVNLAPTQSKEFLCLPASIDMSFMAIHEDPKGAADRAGRIISRRKAGVSPAGNTILQDTDDSANDFEIIKR